MQLFAPASRLHTPAGGRGGDTKRLFFSLSLRDPVATGRRGRQPVRVWGRLLIAQVVKRYNNRRVVEVERRVVHGRADQAKKARAASSGEGVINTAYIERLTGTFRERLARSQSICPNRAWPRHAWLRAA